MSKIVLPAKRCQLRLKWQRFLSHLCSGVWKWTFFKLVIHRSRSAKMILLLTVLSECVCCCWTGFAGWDQCSCHFQNEAVAGILSRRRTKLELWLCQLAHQWHAYAYLFTLYVYMYVYNKQSYTAHLTIS